MKPLKLSGRFGDSNGTDPNDMQDCGGPTMKNTPRKATLGESIDHYGEEYCAHAVNSHEILKRLLEKATGWSVEEIAAEIARATGEKTK